MGSLTKAEATCLTVFLLQPLLQRNATSDALLRSQGLLQASCAVADPRLERKLVRSTNCKSCAHWACK